MKRPSTRSLDGLPSISDVIRVSKAIAMLDAILSPEWDFRYYSFNSNWGPGEMMASMRNGSGDDYFILIDGHGAAIKGFDHESEMSPWNSRASVIWPGMYDSVPEDFASFLNEPAFSLPDVTFCIWRRSDDATWHCGITEFPDADDPDGSGWMLEMLAGDPATYLEFARQYYELDLPLEAVEKIYVHSPLTDELVRALNGDLTVASVAADALEIGYPQVS
jgi:hypothetical protein